MSIYIKGLSFPKDGSSLTIQICPDGSVWKQNWGTVTRAKAIPVPDHGRLIDANKLKEANEKRFRELHHPSNNPQDKTAEFVSYANTWANLGVDDAPTIIPASGE